MRNGNRHVYGNVRKRIYKVIKLLITLVLLIIIVAISSCSSQNLYRQGMIDGCTGMLWNKRVGALKEYDFQLLAVAHRDCVATAKGLK